MKNVFQIKSMPGGFETEGKTPKTKEVVTFEGKEYKVTEVWPMNENLTWVWIKPI